MWAAEQDRAEVVQLLLEKGANMEALDANGCTALMLAADKGNAKVMGLLLEQGASTAVHNKNGETALMAVAAKCCDWEKEACGFFQRGSCRFGARCRYEHVIELCKYYQRGNCRFGAQCRNVHKTPEAGVPHRFGRPAWLNSFWSSHSGRYAKVVTLLLAKNANLGDDDRVRTLASETVSGWGVQEWDPHLAKLVQQLEHHDSQVRADALELLQTVNFRHVFDTLPTKEARCALADRQVGPDKRTMLHVVAAFNDKESEDWQLNMCKVLAPWTSDVKDDAGRSAFDVHPPSKKVRDFFDSISLILGRFSLGRKIHNSDTCIVYFALEIKNRDGTRHTPEPLLVALKFMLRREQFKRELKGRERLGLGKEGNQHVVGVNDYYEDVDFAHAELRQYRFCLVMPQGDRTLQDAITHDNFAGKQLHLVRHIMQSIAEALRFLHEKGIIHADLKPLNIIRVGELWVLIDLDAVVELGQPAGMKFSRAVLPPEMFEEAGVNADKSSMREWSAGEVEEWLNGLTRLPSEWAMSMKEACAKRDDFDGDALTDITERSLQKMLSRAGLDDAEAAAACILAARDSQARSEMPENARRQISVRTPDCANSLEADSSFDSWSYGLLLVHLLTGQPVFNQTIDGNLDEQNLVRLKNWSAQKRKDVQSQISDPAAKDLVSRLLDADPQQRLTMDGVLAHPFFVGQGHEAASERRTMFRVEIFFSRGELEHDKKMLTSLDELKQAITDSLRGTQRDRVHMEHQPNLECFAREVGRLEKNNVHLLHLVGHGGCQGFWWHPRPGKREGEFQDSVDFVSDIALHKEKLPCVFLDGCSMGKTAHMLQAQGIQFLIYWDGPVSDSVSVQFSKFFYEDMFEGFADQWPELFAHTCIRVRAHVSGNSSWAAKRGNIIMLRIIDGIIQEPLSEKLIAGTQTNECEDVSAEGTEHDPFRNWGRVQGDLRWPSQTRVDSKMLARLAGYHEKECLRMAGFVLVYEIDGAGLAHEIGIEDDGTHYGIDDSGMHQHDAMHILWDVPPPPAGCKLDANGACELGYKELWAAGGPVRTRVKSQDAQNIENAIRHLEEAVLCRRLDIFHYGCACLAQSQYLKTASAIDENLTKSQRGVIAGLIDFYVRQGVSQYMRVWIVAATNTVIGPAVEAATVAAQAARASFRLPLCGTCKQQELKCACAKEKRKIEVRPLIHGRELEEDTRIHRAVPADPDIRTGVWTGMVPCGCDQCNPCPGSGCAVDVEILDKKGGGNPLGISLSLGSKEVKKYLDVTVTSAGCGYKAGQRLRIRLPPPPAASGAPVARPICGEQITVILQEQHLAGPSGGLKLGKLTPSQITGVSVQPMGSVLPVGEWNGVTSKQLKGCTMNVRLIRHTCGVDRVEANVVAGGNGPFNTGQTLRLTLPTDQKPYPKVEIVLLQGDIHGIGAKTAGEMRGDARLQELLAIPGSLEDPMLRNTRVGAMQSTSAGFSPSNEWQILVASIRGFQCGCCTCGKPLVGATKALSCACPKCTGCQNRRTLLQHLEVADLLNSCLAELRTY